MRHTKLNGKANYSPLARAARKGKEWLKSLSELAIIIIAVAAVENAFADGKPLAMPEGFSKNGIFVKFTRDAADPYSCTLKLTGEFAFSNKDQRVIAVIRDPQSKAWFPQVDVERNLGSWGVFLFVGSKAYPVKDDDQLEIKLLVLKNLKNIPVSLTDLTALEPIAASPLYTWRIACR